MPDLPMTGLSAAPLVAGYFLLRPFLAAGFGAAALVGLLAEDTHGYTIQTAEVSKGAVHVKGRKAQPLALITWEGQAVAQATSQGGFRFTTSIRPPDCVGELSDGTQTQSIVIAQCGPTGPTGPPGRPGMNCGCCPTPSPSAPPIDSSVTQTVVFDLTVTQPVEGYRIQVSYPFAKGTFAGSDTAVDCQFSGNGSFVPSDQDNGILVFVNGNALALTFPQSVSCTFDATSVLVDGDVTATVTETTQNGGQLGDQNALAVDVFIDSPIPLPTATPGGTGPDCDGEVTTLSATTTSLSGSDLETGWTGIAHNSVVTRNSQVTTNLDCIGDDCTVDGSALVGQLLGAPLPLSSGGVSSCVISEIREAITGTYNLGSGCSESSVKLISRVFLVLDQDKPCPPCVGDPTENDGVKGGTCDGGKTPGAACDVGGISDLFQNAGGAPPDAGRTSNDCQPSGSSVGELNIDLNPLTTGSVTVDSAVNCLSNAFPQGSCYCTGQVQPNACVPDGVCPASGVCEQNPPDGVCSNQTYRQCDLIAGNRDCEDTFPGAGNCEAQLRPCFGTTISRTGVCGTETGTLAAIFCIPATRAAAINTVVGLPGPGTLTVPVSRVRTPR